MSNTVPVILNFPHFRESMEVAVKLQHCSETLKFSPMAIPFTGDSEHECDLRERLIVLGRLLDEAQWAAIRLAQVFTVSQQSSPDLEVALGTVSPEEGNGPVSPPAATNDLCAGGEVASHRWFEFPETKALKEAVRAALGKLDVLADESVRDFGLTAFRLCEIAAPLRAALEVA